MPNSLPSLPEGLTSNPRLLIATTAAVSCTLTAVSVLGFQAVRRATRRDALRKDVKRSVGHSWEEDELLAGPNPGKSSSSSSSMRLGEGSDAKGKEKAAKSGPKEFSEELIREQLARNYVFLGEEGMEKVRKSFVVIVGCGGVGSWAALMLLRSGVTHIRLVDFDLTTLSSLNRHACATLEDVGTPKVQATKKFLEKIAPWATIEAKVGLWRDGQEGYDLVAGADWVVDAIDNITTKVQLLAHCHKSGLKVFSSMGAGAKADPTRVQIADLSLTSEDPLARSIRRSLRLEGVTHGIPVVYSTEVPADVKLLPLPDEEFEKGKVKELSAFDDFRVRILPVLGPLPAIFGLAIATYVLQDLADRPILQPMEHKNRKKMYQALQMNLTIREGKLSGDTVGFKLTLDNATVGHIYEELHHSGRSILPASREPGAPFAPFTHHPICTRPALVRWDFSQPLSVTNCVVMEMKDALRHEEECAKNGKTGRELWGDEVQRGVEGLARDARRVAEWRERTYL